MNGLLMHKEVGNFLRHKWVFLLCHSQGSESNFRKYVEKHGLKKQKEADAHPRFETPYGYQMQFDWKEDMKMTSRHGEL
ncbi:MAG: hypothetical protein PHD89_09380, partial [Bacteroidales bacterium]|nr:hypothetical protein [Bacteroidales bacterium]